MLKGPAECCVGRTLNVMLYLLSLFSDFDRQVSMLPLPSGKECWAQVHFDICWYWLILHDLRGLFGCTFHCFIPCVLDLGLHASVTCYYACFQQLHVEYMSMPIMLLWSWGWPYTVESAMFCIIHLSLHLASVEIDGVLFCGRHFAICLAVCYMLRRAIDCVRFPRWPKLVT